MPWKLRIVAFAIALSTSIGWASARDSQMPPQAPPATPNPAIPPGSYVGEQSCAACHNDKTSTFARPAHRQTSAAPSRDTILGKFDGPEAVMKTANSGLVFRMESRNNGFYQTAIRGVPPSTTSQSARIDLVTGSGRKGKTFFTWNGNALAELPVSFWVTPGHWINSPGYRDGTAEFNNAVTPRCLECHATYFEVIASPNRYNTTNFVLGITCEKCHGPGRDHVTRHTPRPGRQVREGGIVNTGSLSRDRQMDLCATCHGGPGVTPRGQSFTYRPGDVLSTHFIIAPTPSVAAIRPEVHGNQVALLKGSRCYQASEMTCSTCHDVHTTERNIVSMSDRCLTCHKLESCGLFPKSGRKLAGQCVECHMPNETSNRVSITTGGATLQPKFRNHLIKVYPQAPR